MSNIEKIRQEIERRKKENMYDDLPITIGRYYEDRDLLAFIDSLPEEKCKDSPLPEDTVLFQKGVEEGRRLERDDLALSIDDIEKIHVFLYAVKNNKQGAFTFTRLSDEQYKEVLRRFKEAEK